MTPEKLELLRDWIRAEIDYKIIEHGIKIFTTASPESKYRDQLFYQVLVSFCGTD